MVSVWGKSEAIGPVSVGEKPGEIFIARDLAKTANIAAATPHAHTHVLSVY